MSSLIKGLSLECGGPAPLWPDFGQDYAVNPVKILTKVGPKRRASALQGEAHVD
jgi:hypothetical protein